MKTDIDVTKLAQEFEKKTAGEILKWAADTFGGKIAFASSFGAEDVVLIDMIRDITPRIKVFTLDTGRLPEETYKVMDEIRNVYEIEIVSYFPDKKAVEELETKEGFFSFRKSIDARKKCCQIRKVEPLNRALSELKGWITGLRREQAVTRTKVAKIEQDPSHNNIIKINPIADWTHQQVWDYIKKNKVPYNQLHDKNYPSIGCAPCTRPIKPGEDIRAGRWWWETQEQKECGLHVKVSDPTSPNKPK